MTSEHSDTRHIDDAEAAALVYGVTDPSLERRARSHIATCPECATRLEAMRSADRDVAAHLTVLDVAAPSTSVDEIIRRGRIASTPRHAMNGRRAAAIAAFMALAAATAAAIPASPLHRLIVRAFDARSRTAARAPSAPSAMATPSSVVSLVPGNSLEVAFEGERIGGVLRMRLVDGGQVSLSSPAGGATYRVGTSRISVMQSAPGTFDLDVPRSLPGLTIRVGKSVLFDEAPNRAIGPKGLTLPLNRQRRP